MRSWMLMALAGLCGCASSRPPALADYQATLHRGRVVRLDEKPLRYEVVAGDHTVLELHAERAASRWKRDTGATWEILLEFADPARPMADLRALAIVGGESVVYLARRAHGELVLDGDGDPRHGTLDLTFEPERDLTELGTLRLQGRFAARVSP